MKYLITLLAFFASTAFANPYALVGPGFEGSHSGVMVGGGYLWKKNWAAEAAYVDIGRLSGVKLGGYYRTSHKTLQGFAGVNLWALDAENTRSVGTTTTTPATKHKPATTTTTYRDVKSSDSDTALGLAAGVIYHVPAKQSFGMKGVHLRAGYDWIQKKDAWGDKLGILSVVLMKEF
jgi:hypothetical protein